jgi:hypothetical protein
MRRSEFLHKKITGIPNFANRISFQTLEFQKKTTGISGIGNGIGIPLPMGVPGSGTKIGIPNQEEGCATVVGHFQRDLSNQKGG